MNDHSRRSFISTASRAFGSGWLAVQLPLFLTAATTACERRESGAAYLYMTPHLANALGAVAEQILPEDDTPGARDIGVIWFIDALFAGPWSGVKPMLEAGVQLLDERAGAVRFADLPFKEQTAILERVEGEPFFQVMRLLTLAGTFAMPARGGNREKAGWALVGFEDRHAWQPPFGHYDAQVIGEIDDRGETT